MTEPEELLQALSQAQERHTAIRVAAQEARSAAASMPPAQPEDERAAMLRLSAADAECFIRNATSSTIEEPLTVPVDGVPAWKSGDEICIPPTYLPRAYTILAWLRLDRTDHRGQRYGSLLSRGNNAAIKLGPGGSLGVSMVDLPGGGPSSWSSGCAAIVGSDAPRPFSLASLWQVRTSCRGVVLHRCCQPKQSRQRPPAAGQDFHLCRHSGGRQPTAGKHETPVHFVHFFTYASSAYNTPDSSRLLSHTPVGLPLQLTRYVTLMPPMTSRLDAPRHPDTSHPTLARPAPSCTSRPTLARPAHPLTHRWLNSSW